MDTDQILRTIALLQGIKANIPKELRVTQRWVQEYHISVKKASEALEIDLIDFQLFNSDLKPIPVSGNARTGKTKYSEELYCDTSLLSQKVDSLLNYLNLLLQPKPQQEKKIGYDQE